MSSLYVDTPQQSEANFLAAVKDQYRLVKLVGRGSYGFVYEATALPGNALQIEAGARLAIKVVRNVLSGYGAINAKRMLREICILRNLDHVNIMKFRGLIAPPDINNLKDLYIVCDYVVTDLHKILHSDQPITNKHVQYITYQMLKSVRFLHERDIIHRDIKPANMLIDERVSLKLCDFGLARSTSVKPRLQELVVKAKGPKLRERNNKFLPKSPHGPPSTNPSPSLGPTTDGVYRAPANVPALHKKDESPEPATDAPLERPQLKREYTLHVTTRWYRAPELILQSRTYTTAIDIWSVGCILAELIAMQLNSTSRAALFPGDSCFPLSPMANKKDADGYARRPMNDQMKAILDVIGTPSIEEVKKCYPNNWEEVWEYISSFGHKKRIHFSERYRGADDLALQLLHCLLEFDPEKRLSARQALQHPYLRGIVEELGEYDDVFGESSKNLDKDGNPLPSPYFDFEEEPINVAMAQALLVEQVLIDNRHRCSDYIVTREFQQVMERSIRQELMEAQAQHQQLLDNQMSLVHVHDMRDVDSNTEQLNSFLKQLKNCNRYSFVLFPPHQFKSIAVEAPIEGETCEAEPMDTEEVEWEQSTSDNDMNDVTQVDDDGVPAAPVVASAPIGNIFDLSSIPGDSAPASADKAVRAAKTSPALRPCPSSPRAAPPGPTSPSPSSLRALLSRRLSRLLACPPSVPARCPTPPTSSRASRAAPSRPPPRLCPLFLPARAPAPSPAWATPRLGMASLQRRCSPTAALLHPRPLPRPCPPRLAATPRMAIMSLATASPSPASSLMSMSAS